MQHVLLLLFGSLRQVLMLAISQGIFADTIARAHHLANTCHYSKAACTPCGCYRCRAQLVCGMAPRTAACKHGTQLAGKMIVCYSDGLV
jgi:hypothetical protein